MNKITKNITAKSHPSHYMMHKYWGRKPHNVVSDYILNFTKPGETILDPFMGSGVVVIESLKNKRKAIGIDLNPMACFITKNTIDSINLDDFEKTFDYIYKKNYTKFSKLYNTRCPKCGSISPFENSIWENENFSKIKGLCNNCGKFTKKAEMYDQNIIKESIKIFHKLDKENKIFYPKDQILKFVKRNGKARLNEFFTERSLVILGSIIKDINKIKDINTKNLILLCFTSMLPNVSNMIPGDSETVNGKSGWVISKLWVPKIHTEKNIFNSFKNRFQKIKTGKQELFTTFEPKDAKIFNIDSTNLEKIKSKSIDYIFTDPPYGDSIAYFGLSMFWNAWLKNKVDYENEIIYDPYRDKKYDDYGLRMKKVYSELYRVLKDKKYMSFTFHNRNLNIWKAVMDAVTGAGFHLVNIVYQEQAVASGTQGINKKNTLRGDFIYNFQKNTGLKSKAYNTNYKNNEKEIIKKIETWLQKNNNFLTSDSLYKKLIPYIVEENLYNTENGKVIDIEGLLNKNFTYTQNQAKEYGWKKK